MSHGVPDFGATAGGKTTYQLTDLAEQAVRLGSIVTFDRLGDVAALDDFESGLGRIYKDTAGTGASVTLTAGSSRSGLLACLLTAGSTGSHYAGVSKRAPMMAPGKHGVEVSWATGLTVSSLRLGIIIYDGETYYYGAIQWVGSSGDIEYCDKNGDWQTLVSALVLIKNVYYWHTMKLTIDPVGGVYGRCLIDGTGVAVGDYPLYSVPSSVGPEFRGLVRNYGRSGYNDHVRVDDLILTQNEP